MSNLWTQAASSLWETGGDRDFDEENHDEHSLHPAFEAAGVRHAPCAFTRCPEYDDEHSETFDRAEKVADRYRKQGARPPVESVDLSKPVYGFETTADMHTLRRYTHDPKSRPAGNPVMFRHQGQHYLYDGHHGTSAALRRGDSHLDVHMIDLDKED